MNKIFILMLTAFFLIDLSPRRAEAFTTFHLPDGTPLKWDLTTLPGREIPWQVSTDSPPMVRDAAAAAAQAWTDATGGKVNFKEGQGGISIVWDSTGKLLFDPVFLAYTSFQIVTGNKIESATIVINAGTYDWHRGAPSGVGPVGKDGKRDACLDCVILHEMGHALGLDHSDKNPAAIVGVWSAPDLPTMNSWIIPGAESLHTDDIAGVRSIYGSGDNSRSIAPILISASSIRGRKPFRVVFTQTGGDSDTLWDFGDGTFGIGSFVRHRFNSFGTFTVRAESNGRSGDIQIEVLRKMSRRAR